MQLAFYARAGHSVAWPNSAATGQPRRYVGRTFVPSLDKETAGAFRADKEAAVVKAKDADAKDLMRACAKGGLWPADEATAKACGVDFVKVEADADGEWVAAKAAKRADLPKTPKEG